MRHAWLTVALLAGCSPIDLRPLDVAAVNEDVPASMRSELAFADRTLHLLPGMVTAALPVGWQLERPFDTSWYGHVVLREPETHEAMLEIGDRCSACAGHDLGKLVDSEFLYARRFRDVVVFDHVSANERVYLGFAPGGAAWYYRVWWHAGAERYRVCGGYVSNRRFGLAHALLHACQTAR